MTVGIQRTNYTMAMGMQRMRIRPMAVGTQRSGDNLDTEATHSRQRKMTKTQQMGIKPMATGAQRMDSGPKAEANHYMREAWRKDNSLKNTNFD